jgi:hypothetical protein
MERIEKSTNPVESTNGCPLSEIQRDRPAIIQKLIAITMKHEGTSACLAIANKQRRMV